MSRRRIPARAALALAVAATAVTPAAASATAGDLDQSFGTAGKRILPGSEQPLDVFVQSDGKIVEVGGVNSLFPGLSGFLVRRMLPDGSPDKSFDGDGTAVAKFPNLPPNVEVTPEGAALQPDGAIVVAGGAGSAGVAVARFTPAGSLDRNFDEGGADGDGRALISTTLTGFAVTDLALQPGGKIVLSGSQGNNADFAALRLRSDGSVDSTAFDLADFAGNNDLALASAQGEDGTLTVAGTSQGNTGPQVSAVVRYKSDGKLDTSLAGSGKVKIAAIDSPAAVAVQPDGKTLVTGTADNAQRRAVVVRLTREGDLDATFGQGGSVEIRDSDREDVPSAIVLQPDGKILVGGALGGTAENTTFEGFVARYDAAGRPDPSYGSGGRAAFSLGEVALGGPMAVQADGKVVFSAYAVGNGIVPRPVVARLLADPEPAGPAPGGGGEQPTTQQPQQQEPGGTTTTPRDTTKPGLAGLRVVKTRSGREARFTLSEPARVQFTIQRAPRKGRSKPVRGSFSIAAPAGRNRIDIARRSIVRRLAAGRYLLVATAVDAAGNKGTATRAAFTVASKKKK